MYGIRIAFPIMFLRMAFLTWSDPYYYEWCDLLPVPTVCDGMRSVRDKSVCSFLFRNVSSPRRSPGYTVFSKPHLFAFLPLPFVCWFPDSGAFSNFDNIVLLRYHWLTFVSRAQFITHWCIFVSTLRRINSFIVL